MRDPENPCAARRGHGPCPWLLMLVLAACGPRSGWGGENLFEKDFVPAPGEPVRGLGVSADGRFLAVAWSLRAECWDLLTLQRIHSDTAKTHEFRCAACSADGAWSATGCDDGVIRLINNLTRKEAANIKLPAGVSSIVFTPDSAQVVVAARDGMVRAWETKTGKRALEFETHEFGLVRLDVSPDGKRLVTGSSDQLAAYWDLETGERLARLVSGVKGIKAHLGMVMDIKFMPDGQRAVTAALQDGAANLARVHATPDGDDILRVWDLKRGAPEFAYRERFGAWALAVHPEKELIYVVKSYTAFPFGRLREVDLKTGRREEFPLGPNLPDEGFSALALAAGPSWLVAGTSQGRLYFLDLNERTWLGALALLPEGWAARAPDGHFDLDPLWEGSRGKTAKPSWPEEKRRAGLGPEILKQPKSGKPGDGK